MAEDPEGNSLGESVKKLIGLDLIEKLIADITVFIRNQNKQLLTDDIKSKITGFEKFLDIKEQLIEMEQSEYDAIRIQLTHATSKIDQLTNNLNSHGGAWAATREEEIKKLSGYKAEKEMLQAQIRDGITDSFPFSIAPDFVKHCVDQLEREEKFKNNKNIASVLSKHLASLEDRLLTLVDQPAFASIKKEMDSEFADLLSPQAHTELIHDASDSLQKKITFVALDALNNQELKIKNLAKKLALLNQQIDEAGVNIARAPEHDLLTVRIKELNDAQAEKSEIAVQASQQKEKIKGHLREAMDIVRKLESLHATFLDSDEGNRALSYANKAKTALTEFAKRVAINKIKNIEIEFNTFANRHE